MFTSEWPVPRWMCVTFPLCVNVAVAPCCLGDACGTTICLLHEATRCTTMYSSCPSRLSPEPSGTPLVTPHTPHAPHPLSLSLSHNHTYARARPHTSRSRTRPRPALCLALSWPWNLSVWRRCPCGWLSRGRTGVTFSPTHGRPVSQDPLFHRRRCRRPVLPSSPLLSPRDGRALRYVTCLLRPSSAQALSQDPLLLRAHPVSPDPLFHRRRCRKTCSSFVPTRCRKICSSTEDVVARPVLPSYPPGVARSALPPKTLSQDPLFLRTHPVSQDPLFHRRRCRKTCSSFVPTRCRKIRSSTEDIVEDLLFLRGLSCHLDS